MQVHVGRIQGVSVIRGDNSGGCYNGYRDITHYKFITNAIL